MAALRRLNVRRRRTARGADYRRLMGILGPGGGGGGGAWRGYGAGKAGQARRCRGDGAGETVQGRRGRGDGAGETGQRSVNIMFLKLHLHTLNPPEVICTFWH